MAKDKEEIQAEKGLVDLSALADLNLGPRWSNPKTQYKSREGEYKPKRSDGAPRKDFKRDRRPEFSREKRSYPEIFRPTVSVNIYPEDEPFMALVKAMKTSCKTYELFEIAHLILEKPDRFVAVIERKGESEDPNLYTSPVDGVIFEAEDQAIAHTLKNYADKFFDIEETEVEAPKGSFPVVNKCGITGELLGPPNYHRYQELLKEHYENNVSNVPYSRFLEKIESVKDQEQIDSWIEKMKKQKRYILKGTKEGEEAMTFDTWDAARLYMVANNKKKLVYKNKTVRLHGAALEKMPESDIKRSVEAVLKKQKEFPLDTANNLRGRLRRIHFNLYKKGAKGIAYVCWVKRKFRQEGVALANDMDRLVKFIEENDKVSVNDLPQKYLGIEPVGKKEEGSEEEPKPHTPEQQAEIRKLMLNLRWLVTEGYVTEYGDGTLCTSPPMPVAKKDKAGEAKETKEEPTKAGMVKVSEETKAIEVPEAQEPENTNIAEETPVIEVIDNQ